ncbi:helix-turn-helix domain-containing protein [Aliarcobacter lanthieri]|uniref:helix-turn-helix domain-containing protein n=1 Tax=Aliarcobacter lanthieri TaxID=1355374 RepID=UPI00047D5D42|nr:AraC family transcriptional regulator [Aliarcobacter lanthieri]QKF58524.1 transcriptional regulator, AraC family [Aliarcobacter lanthieri]
MSQNFNLKDISEFINYSSTNEDFKINLPDNFGSMSCNKEIINEDICIFKTKAQANKNFSIEHETKKVDSLLINIILEGKIKYQTDYFDKVGIFKTNDTYIQYLDESCSKTSLDKDDFSKGLGIFIKNSFLEKHLSSYKFLIEEFKNPKNNSYSNFIHKTETNINIKLANELFNSPFTNELHNIYLQSKVLEIIYNEFNEIKNCICKNECSCEKIKLSNDDIEALYKARDIILLTHDFPDLPSLARRVAINEFKLKFGFRKLFNTTVGQMILERKMIYAKQLLETSEYSVSEVAFYVGYKYQQSFSNAFFQFFGIRPKDIMKKRNYYY